MDFLKVRLFLVGLVLLMSFCGYRWVTRSRMAVIEQQVREQREVPVVAPVSPEMLRMDAESRLQSLIHSDPEQAVAALEGDAGAVGLGFARKRLPAALLARTVSRLKERRFEDATSDAERLAALEGPPPEAGLARKALEQATREWAWDAAAKGDWVQAEKQLQRLVQRAEALVFQPGRDVAEAIAAHRVSLWETKGPDAEASLEVAGALSDDRGALAAAIEKRGPSILLSDGRKLLAEGRACAAVVFLRVAKKTVRFPNNTGDRAYPAATGLMTDIDDALAEARLKAMSIAARGDSPWLQPQLALNFSAEVINHALERRRSKKEDLQRWNDLQREAVLANIRARGVIAQRKAAEGEFAGALQDLDMIYRADVPWLIDLKVAAGVDVLKDLPDEVKARMVAEGQTTAGQQAARASYWVGQGLWRPDLMETRNAENASLEIRAKWGLSLLEAPEQLDREKGQSLLRTLLRDARGTDLVALVAMTLRSRLDRAGRESDFETLLSLASLYVAEIDPPPQGDPFHDVLKDHLLAAARHFEAAAPLKRLFLLTLLADVFPASPEGLAARAEAQQKVFALISAQNPEPMVPLLGVDPSGLPGLSVNPIENGTAYHLLLFFEGPERFFVRVPPMRRGVAVFKSGNYKHAALVTADQVVPYRGEHEWSDRLIHSKYRIVTRTSRGETTNSWEHNATTLGDYVLLRSPDETRFKVDPREGGVTKP